MNTYEFELKFSLPMSSPDPDYFVERLAESGCTDALVGIGQTGRIAFHFARNANSAFEAVLSAVSNIKKAIPEATLIEAAPDLVGLSDIADILGYSRQNIRKLMINNMVSFPVPIHEGKTVLWHLSSILSWVKESNRYQIDELLLDVANANMQLNIAKESVHVDASIQKHFLAKMSQQAKA
jgi:predicted DNA-binding transcriptional regulator AlpA